MKLQRFIVLLSISSILFGCASLKEEGLSAQNKTTHSHELEQFAHWRLQGKLGLKTPQDSKSAYLDWKNKDLDYRISLHGLFGLGRVQINKNGNEVEVKSKKEIYRDTSARLLLLNITGWDLPIEGLQYWIKGQLDPTSVPKNIEYDQTNTQIQTLNQNGWNIRYLKYTSYKNLTLPSKLTASRDGLKLTLVIKKWDEA